MSDISNVGSHVGSHVGTSTASGLGTAGVRTSGDTLAARAAAATPSAIRTAANDRVEVSEVARWLEEMNRLPAVREDKVAAARAAIAAGNYDSDEKLSLAINRMIDDIG